MKERASFTFDKKTLKVLNTLAEKLNSSKSEIIRKSVKEYCFNEKMLANNLLFFVDAFNTKLIDKNMLLMLLPRKEVEHVMIGSQIGKKATGYARKLQ